MRQFLILAAAFTLLLSLSCGDGGPPPPTAVNLDGVSETADRNSLSAKPATQSIVYLRIADSGNHAVSSGIDTVLVYRGFASRDTFLTAGTADMPDNDGVMAVGISTIPGDFNGDGRVDFYDFFRFSDSAPLGYQTASLSPEQWPYDLDQSGKVDFQDFFIFAEWFGAGVGAAKATADETEKIHQRIIELSDEYLKFGNLLWRYYAGEITLDDMAKDLSVPYHGVVRPKITGPGDVALRFVIRNSAAHAPRDTTITKDWQALVQAIRSGSDNNNLVRVVVRTVPRVNTARARSQIDAGAGFVGRFALSEFFEREPDGGKLTFNLSPSVPGVSIQDSTLVVSFKDSTVADFSATLTATNSAGLTASHSFLIHRAAVTTRLSVVLPDTLRVGDEVRPSAKREVYWDGKYRSTDSTNASIIALVEPARLERTGLNMVTISHSGQTQIKEVLVRPRKDDDFLKIRGVIARPLERKITVRIASGIDSVAVSLNLNNDAMPQRNVPVAGDSAVAEFSVLFAENQKVTIFTEVTDRFSNRDTLTTTVTVGDLTPPAVQIDSVRVTKDRIIWSLWVDDAGGFSGRNNNFNPLTITAVDTLRKHEVFSRATGLTSQGANRYVSWTGAGGVDFPTTAANRVLRVALRVRDDGGNVTAKEIVLTQPATVAPVTPVQPQEVIKNPQINVPTTLISITGQVNSTQIAERAVSNAGNANLNLENIYISGGAGVLTVSPGAGVISPSGRLTLGIIYKPTQAVATNAELVVVSNDPNRREVRIPIYAAGTAAPVAIISASPTSIAFGDTLIGKSKTRTFSVSNIGNALLTVSGIASTNSVFSANPTSFTVALGNAQTVSVAFMPTAAQNYSASLTITASNDGVAVVNVSGTGTTAPEPPTPKIPDIALSNQTLNFGEAHVFSSATLTLTVSNPSDTTLVVYGVPSTNPWFSTDSATGFTLGAGQSRTVTAVFSPQAVGTATGQLIITSNDPDEGSLVVNVVGTGTSIPAPEIVASPASLLFTTEVNTTASGQAVISNTGTAALSVFAVSISGAGLSVSPNQATTINPGQQVSLTVAFAPIVAGVVNSSLVIVSNDVDEQVVTIPITATATDVPQVFLPDIAVSPGSLNFGSLDIGLSGTLTIQVANEGNANLSNVAVSALGAGFSVLGTPPSMVISSSSITVVVKFEPGSAGVFSGILRITSNDPDESQVDISLSGTGTTPPPAQEPNVGVNQTSFAFGNLAVGSASVQSLVISNTGNAPATVAISPQTSDGFSINSPDASFTLAASSTRSVPIMFAPSAPLTSSGSFTVASNDPDTPSITISCTGTGVAAVLNLLTDSINFGEVQQSQSAARWLKVRNDGNLALNVLFGASGVFSLSGASLAVPPGATDSVQVVFAPSAVQSYTGSVSLQSNGGTVTVTLSGNGTAAPAPNIQSVTVNGTQYSGGTDIAISIPAGSNVTVSVATQNTTSVRWTRIYMSGLTQKEEVVLSSASGTIANPFSGASGRVTLRIDATGISGAAIQRVYLDPQGAP